MQVIDSILMVEAWLHGAIFDKVGIGRVFFFFFFVRAISLLLVEADTCDVMPLTLQEDSYLLMMSFFLTPADTLGLSKGSDKVGCESLFSLFALGLLGTYFST